MTRAAPTTSATTQSSTTSRSESGPARVRRPRPRRPKIGATWRSSHQVVRATKTLPTPAPKRDQQLLAARHPAGELGEADAERGRRRRQHVDAPAVAALAEDPQLAPRVHRLHRERERVALAIARRRREPDDAVRAAARERRVR